jgi:hypothetical protein
MDNNRNVNMNEIETMKNGKLFQKMKMILYQQWNVKANATTTTTNQKC